MKTAEIEVRLQAKESLEQAATGRGKERSSCRSLEEAQPCQHLDFRLLASRAVREYISIV